MTLRSILRGSLAPGGAVAKITGKEGLSFTGKARTFDSEDEFVKAVENGTFKKGEKAVAILRYLGPKGGPGAFSAPFHRAVSHSHSPLTARTISPQACRRCSSPPA